MIKSEKHIADHRCVYSVWSDVTKHGMRAEGPSSRTRWIIRDARRELAKYMWDYRRLIRADLARVRRLKDAALSESAISERRERRIKEVAKRAPHTYHYEEEESASAARLRAWWSGGLPDAQREAA